jgi:hypothetical protein
MGGKEIREGSVQGEVIRISEEKKKRREGEGSEILLYSER